MGVDMTAPRLSWMMTSSKRGDSQTSFQVLVSSSRDNLNADIGDLWDTGKVSQSESTLHPYGGSTLLSRQRCWWKVRIWNRAGKLSEWSLPAFWEMGLLAQDDWTPAQWIRLGYDDRDTILASSPVQTATMSAPTAVRAYACPLFRKKFISVGKVIRARAYICGLGCFELYLNGRLVGDTLLNPSITTYDQRAFYVTHKISSSLRHGANVLGVIVGNGFYGQNMAFGSDLLAWGQPGLIAKIIVDYADGTVQEICTDATWKVATGPILYDNIYGGETYNAQSERKGWLHFGYDDAGWQNAQPTKPLTANLRSQHIPAIKKCGTEPAQKISAGVPGGWIIDFGRNIAGWVRMRVNEAAGTEVTVHLAEALTPDGLQIDPRSTGSLVTGLVQTDIYVCRGDTVPEVHEPRFTYHGFRYAQVSGLTKRPTLDQFEAVCVRTSVDRRGTFSCSDAKLNRVYETSVRTLESNIHGTLEDCPHREKCGWLGDAHIVAEMAIYNFEMARLLRKICDDIATTAGQGVRTNWGSPATPGIPCNISVGKRLCGEAMPDCGVATVFLPWYLYLYYGDNSLLFSQYDNIRRWLDHVSGLSIDHIVPYGFGDWWTGGGTDATDCPPDLTSTALHCAALKIASQVATLVGRPDDARDYERQHLTTKAAFINEFLDLDAMTFGSQTANAVALRYGLVPAGKEAAIAKAVVSDITKKRKGHVHAGVHGARAIYTLLSEYGHDKLAFALMRQSTFPSFGYLLNCGYTTWPEEPLDMKLAGTVPPPSQNHCMRAGFAAWFHECVGGIRPLADAPGFRKIEMKPSGVRQLDWAEAVHHSMHGEIRSRWMNNNGTFQWFVTVPANTQATVWLPARDPWEVRESGQVATRSEGVTLIGFQSGFAKFRIGGGDYEFVSVLPTD